MKKDIKSRKIYYVDCRFGSKGSEEILGSNRDSMLDHRFGKANWRIVDQLSDVISLVATREGDIWSVREF